MSQRPGDSDNFLKNSIGNYKGVMLCNRPDEMGQVRKTDPQGPIPFNSRVDPKETTGITPIRKVVLQPLRKKDPQSILLKHKQYLAVLQSQKNHNRVAGIEHQVNQIERTMKFKKRAEDKRNKIRGDVILPPLIEHAELTQERPQTSKPQASRPQSKQIKKRQKPQWAKTEKEVEGEKDKEIDELIDFAYQLNYEQYIEDFEVKQALEILKERVNEIKKDDEWKEKIIKEWNEDKGNNEIQNEKENTQENINEIHKDTISVRSNISRSSMRCVRQKLESVREEGRPEWDASVRSERQKEDFEQKLASKLAEEVLRINPVRQQYRM